MSNLRIHGAGFLKRLEVASQRRKDFDLDRIIAELRECSSLCDLADRYGLMTDPQEAEHLRADWYGEGQKGGRSRWWPDHDVQEIVREAYIRTFSLVRDCDAPIRAIWISGMPDFVVSVIPSPLVVVMALLTPSPPSVVGEAVKDGTGMVRGSESGVMFDPGVMKG